MATYFHRHSLGGICLLHIAHTHHSVSSMQCIVMEIRTRMPYDHTE